LFYNIRILSFKRTYFCWY